MSYTLYIAAAINELTSDGVGPTHDNMIATLAASCDVIELIHIRAVMDRRPPAEVEDFPRAAAIGVCMMLNGVEAGKTLFEKSVKPVDGHGDVVAPRLNDVPPEDRPALSELEASVIYSSVAFVIMTSIRVSGDHNTVQTPYTTHSSTVEQRNITNARA